MGMSGDNHTEYRDPYKKTESSTGPITEQLGDKPSYTGSVPSFNENAYAQRSTQAPAVQQRTYTPADFGGDSTKKKKKRKFPLAVAAVCLSLIISGGSFYAGAVYNANSTTTGTSETAVKKTGKETSSKGEQTTSSVTPTAATTLNINNEGTEVTSAVTEVVENVMPSMVAINTMSETTMSYYNPYYYYFYGDDYSGGTYQVSGSGSGIIIAQNDTELLIATNNHVIEDADSIAVEFIDNESYDATVKGTSSDNDLAVIAVNISDISADTLSKIKVAPLGNSDTLKLGEPAIAIGNSLGYGQSVTVGYISALNREIHISDKTMTLIQTDAAINPGNSGGALLNIKGEVIGINSAKYSDTDVEGTGYAIPISKAEPIINELISSDHVSEDEQAYLGIYGQDVPKSYQERYDWPEGVYVSNITKDSPASLAGIKAGDIITSIDGKDVDGMDKLQSILAECKVGQKIEIDITRISDSGKQSTGTVTATLVARKEASDSRNELP